MQMKKVTHAEHLSYICSSHGKVHSKDVFAYHLIVMEFQIVICVRQFKDSSIHKRRGGYC